MCRDRQPDIGEPALICVYETIRRSAFRGHLLPQLQQLCWCHEHSRSAYCSFIDIFLGPAVTSICVRHIADALSPVLAALGQMVGRLVSVELHPVDEYSTDSDHTMVYSFLRTLTHVEVLNVSTIDSEALTHLGRLTTVKTLSTILPEKYHPRVPDGTMFSNLRAANIAVGDGEISVLIAFVRTWKTPRLTSFEVEVKGCGELEHIRDFYAVLATHCEPNDLRTLSVQIYHGHADSVDIIIPHPGHALQPLFAFNHLTSLEIRVPSGYELDDGTISDMARAYASRYSRLAARIIPTITLNIRPNVHSLPSMASPSTAPALRSLK